MLQYCHNVACSIPHTHTHTPTQPRNDDHHEENLDGCLTIQQLQCATGTHNVPSKPNRANGGPKSSKLKPLKTEKSRKSPNIHHQIPNVNMDIPSLLTSKQTTPTILLPYTISDGQNDYYSTLNLPHLSPASPGSLHSPMIPSPQGSQLYQQAYQLSPKMAQASGVYPCNHASPHTTSNGNMYSSNPASPMQVAYSPGQPLMRLQPPSSANMYPQQSNGPLAPNGLLEPQSNMSIQQSFIPSHPPPNYSEATGLAGGTVEYVQIPLGPGFQPLLVGSEFPANHLAALPPGNETHGDIQY